MFQLSSLTHCAYQDLGDENPMLWTFLLLHGVDCPSSHNQHCFGFNHGTCNPLSKDLLIILRSGYDRPISPSPGYKPPRMEIPSKLQPITNSKSTSVSGLMLPIPITFRQHSHPSKLISSTRSITSTLVVVKRRM